MSVILQIQLEVILIIRLQLSLSIVFNRSFFCLFLRWADTMTSESTDGKRRGFDHPFLQACGMFLGETMCMAAFFLVRWKRRRNLASAGSDTSDDPFLRPRNFSPLVFLPPALCDMTATSIQYIGLTLTYASSFQMLRGEKDESKIK